MSDNSAEVPSRNSQIRSRSSFISSFIKFFLLRFPFPFIVLGSAWYFSEFKLALTNFISDHPTMLLGGLPGIVLFTLLILYHSILTLEDMKILDSKLRRISGRILAIILPYGIFLSILFFSTTLSSVSGSAETELLKSFTWYYVTIILLVVIPPAASSIRTFIGEKIGLINTKTKS